jgi:hypothetical protein
MLDEQHINLLKKHANFEQPVPRKKIEVAFFVDWSYCPHIRWMQRTRHHQPYERYT